MPSNFVLEVDLLCKKFGTFTAVDNISFGVKEGEILGLLGINGAGKTTTIQMLLDLLEPTSGSIRYFGKELANHREEILEHVNFSSTYTNLPWRLTPRESLYYTLYFYDIKDRDRRFKQIVEQFQLQECLNKELAQLSTGQKTRVNLAKAFINYPRVILLDEPTASLDPETAHEIREFILNQQKQFGVSVLFTSHNMPEVEEVCDRIIFLSHGKIIAEDTPEKLAKSLKYTSLTLIMRDGLKRTEEVCVQEQLKHTINNRSITIRIEEHSIATFLSNLATKQIEYDQISIDKPTLEDYFLEVAGKHETT